MGALSLVTLALLLGLGCDGPSPAVDAGVDSGPLAMDAGVDAGPVAVDAGADAGEADAGVDAGEADAGPPDASAPCVTSFRCEAESADFECGVATADGRRHPDLGAPYCSTPGDPTSCACDLVRCVSPMPVCPGTYLMRARERLLSGCNGRPGELDGTCAALLNVAESSPDGAPLASRNLLNVTLSFEWAEYEHEVVVGAPTEVLLRVEQDTWFEDVSGVGNAGRSELDWVELIQAP